MIRPPFRKEATLLAVGAVTLAFGVVGAIASGPVGPTAAEPAATTSAPTLETVPRIEAEPLSRGGERAELETPEATAEAQPSAALELTPESQPSAPATRTLYTTTTVNVREAADAGSDLVTTLAEGKAVTAVGDAVEGWQQVSVSDSTGYVSAQYLSAQAPATPTATASSSKATTTSKATGQAASSGYPACASGSAVESGLTAKAINVHRAVCNTFPAVTSYGGWRADGEHADGRAIDIMVSGATGREITAWLRANAGSLGINSIIYEQKIWTRQRSAEGWRSMSDRGSATANHYDHIHVQVTS